MGPVKSVLRAAARREGGPLNILTCPTHESWETEVAKTNARFWAVRSSKVKDWNPQYRPLPPNYTLLPKNDERVELPADVEFDLVVSQNKAGQFGLLVQLARALHLPLLSIEHTLPHPQWSAEQLAQLKGMKGHANAFISEYSRKAWGWSGEEAEVVHHGINTEAFRPLGWKKRPFVLSVVNQFKEPVRHWCMPAGQKVLTSVGWVPVEKVVPGMEVLTRSMGYRRVKETFSRHYFGDMIEVKLSRDRSAFFTASHEVYAKQSKGWAYTTATSLRPGQNLYFPRHTRTDFVHTDKDYAWLIGLIVGDGSITKAGAISIVFAEGDDESGERARRILTSVVGNARRSDRANKAKGAKCFTVEAASKIFGRWLRDQIGRKGHEKRLPDFIMRGSDEVRIAALQGLWSADGSFKNGNKANRSPRASFATISPTLACQVSELLMSYGVRCNIQRQNRRTNKSAGRWLPILRVVGYGKENIGRARSLIDEGVSHGPVEYEIENVLVDPEWAGTVYNLSVDEDPSYVVGPGFVAHNCCGFPMWEQVIRGLPYLHFGESSDGWSRPARDVQELVTAYNECAVFVDTASFSPIPTVVLEAMACGAVVVSRGNAMVPEVISHGVNGFIEPSVEGMRKRLEDVLADPEAYRHVGAAARATIVERFNLDRFVKGWDGVFRRAASIPYTGEFH